MNDTRKRLIAALQKMRDKCADRMPYAEGWKYDFLRGRYSAIMDMVDKVKEIFTDKQQDNDNRY